MARPGRPERNGTARSFRQLGDSITSFTAPGERLKSDFTTRWYQFCVCDIVSMLCMSILGVRIFTEPVFFTEDDMAKKAKKAKKTAKAATKKLTKKTSKKKK
jgi:hypothetical protein